MALGKGAYLCCSRFAPEHAEVLGSWLSELVIYKTLCMKSLVPAQLAEASTRPQSVGLIPGPLGHAQGPSCSHHRNWFCLCQLLYATQVTFSRRKWPGAPWGLPPGGDWPLLRLFHEGIFLRSLCCPCPTANTHRTSTMNGG